MPDHGVRHFCPPLPATLGNAANGGGHPGAGRDDRRLLSGPDLSGQARHGWGSLRTCSPACRRGRSSWRSASWRNGHAAQPLFALGAGPDPPDRKRCAEQVHGLPLLLDRCGDCAQRGVFRQCGDPHFERGGFSPAWYRGRHDRESVRAAPQVPRERLRQSSSPLLSCAPARVQPSRERSPARS